LEQRFFLKENIKIEPLVNRWYANPHVLYPPTAAYLLRQQLEIMSSFVKHPALHQKMSSVAEMRGGPFVQGLTSEHVGLVQALIDKTREDCRHLLELGDGLDAAKAMLKTADGHSLIPSYEKLPPVLRGRAELIYRHGRQAHFRLFEPLFYDAFPLDHVQELAVAPLWSDDRPFVLSTPRVAASKDFFLKLPFASESARALTRAKWHGLSSQQVDSLFEACSEGNGDKAARDRFQELFTSEPMPEPQDSKTPRIRYFGHACALIETGEENILVDPLISYGFPGHSPRLTYRDLPKTIDYVIITHTHQDHCVLETLLQIRDRVKTIVVPQSNPGELLDPSMKTLLLKLGFERVVTLDTFDELPLKTGVLRAIPFLGEHGDLDIRSKTGYMVETRGRRVMFLADSNNLDEQLYEHVRERYGAVDIIFLGMECEGAPVSWLYGPMLGDTLTRSMDASRRLNGSNADAGFKLVKTLGAKHVYIYAMAQEPWLTFISSLVYDESSLAMRQARQLISECAPHGIHAELLCGSKDLGALK
jgi:L-ascorbate metabolism protein UlaG (beta-lactamase superfamily)